MAMQRKERELWQRGGQERDKRSDWRNNEGLINGWTGYYEGGGSM